MAEFKYKLQNILNLRENIEKEKKNNFGIAVKRLENEKKTLKEFQSELDELYNQSNSETSDGISIFQLRIFMQYAEYYKRAISNQQVKIKMAEEYLEECRNELIKASQEKKMMEKLKTVEKTKYLYEEQKKEEKVIDDIVTFREGRKKINNI